MRLKHYMRGLGIGIAVTAAILCIARFSTAAKPMSDDEIISRAKELGMIENTILAAPAADNALDIQAAPPSNTAEENTEDIIENNTENNEALPNLTPVMDSDISGNDTDSPPQKADSISNKDTDSKSEITGDLIPIEVKNGDGSMNVANRLEAAGLVKSASAFDTYLCDNDYDNILTIGVHMIPKGSSEEEIAQILMKRT